MAKRRRSRPRTEGADTLTALCKKHGWTWNLQGLGR